MTISKILEENSVIKYVKNEDRPYENCSKISSRIFLGNYKCAKDKNFLKKNNIKAVLNCTIELPNYFQTDKNIEYLKIPVDDSLKKRDFDLMNLYLPLAVEFIHKHVNILKHNILIHCYMGRQRSMVCLVSYLVKYGNKSPSEACLYAMKKRPEAFHFGTSFNFEKSFVKYCKTLK